VFSDAHTHFDDPMFVGLVPDFADVEWLSLASMAAEAVADVLGSFLIQVPIGEWEHVPERFDLPSLDTLRPWQPPSIHLLREGSAFEIRASHQPDAWHHDVAPPAIGAVGWVSGDRDDEAGVWRLSLMYETPQPSK
jgi:hypothetical protein